MLTPVRDLLAGPQLPDHVHRLLQQLEPLPRQRPARTGDVLVEVLARADAEEEAAPHHARDRRGRLRDDRRVDPDERARDTRPHADPLSRICYPT